MLWSASWRISVTAMQCEGSCGRKTTLASWVKYPSLLTDFKPTCTARNARSVSALFDMSVTPLQCEGSYGRKTASALRVKCPSLLTDLNQNCCDCSACAVSGRCDVSVASLQYEDRQIRRTTSVTKWVSFIIYRFEPNLYSRRWQCVVTVTVVLIRERTLFHIPGD
jgi:hypothetical protein